MIEEQQDAMREEAVRTAGLNAGLNADLAARVIGVETRFRIWLNDARSEPDLGELQA